MRTLLCAALAAIVVACPLPAFAQDASPRGMPVMVPDVLTPATTISAQCSTPATGCSTGQWVTSRVGGRNSIVATVTPANFTGTLTCYFSKDGGVNWWQGLVRDMVADYENGITNAWATTVAYVASSTIKQLACGSVYGAATDVAIISTAAVTNTASVVLSLSNYSAESKMLEQTMATKGNGALGPIYLGVQQPKDVGRSYVAIGADGVTPAIAETVVTFTKTVADTQTTGQTSYTITNAKTFRIQSICASATMGAAANRVRVALRLNTGGACIAGSNILLPVVELAPNYGTATAAEGGASQCMPIPDGLEIAGNGTKAICLSESATAASGTLSVALVGYEY